MYREPRATTDIEEAYLHVKVKGGKQGHDNANDHDTSERSKALD